MCKECKSKACVLCLCYIRCFAYSIAGIVTQDCRTYCQTQKPTRLSVQLLCWPVHPQTEASECQKKPVRKVLQGDCSRLCPCIPYLQVHHCRVLVALDRSFYGYPMLKGNPKRMVIIGWPLCIIHRDVEVDVQPTGVTAHVLRLVRDKQHIQPRAVILMYAVQQQLQVR